MNFGELVTRTRIYCDDPSGDRFSDVAIKGFINEAQWNIQAEIDMTDELFFRACKNYDVDPTEDAWEFALPSDFKRVLLAERLTTGDPIPAAWIDFRRRHETATSEVSLSGALSRPVCYLAGQKLGVVDTDADYTLRLWYVKRLAQLVDSATVSEIPLEWHDLICLEAAKIGLGAIQRELSTGLQEIHALQLQRMKQNLSEREYQSAKYVHYIPD